MNLVEEIKAKAKMGTEIENLLDTDLEEEWQQVAEIQWVRLDDVLALLPDYIIIRKQGDLHGEKAFEEVIEWMHGKTVVDKQKLREFEELLKNRPKTIFPPSSRTAWCNPEKSAEYFELLEKKLEELTK